MSFLMYIPDTWSHKLTALTKKIKLISLLVLIIVSPIVSFSQKRDKDPEYNYISLGTNLFTNAPGTIGDKIFTAVEFGRSYGIFDLGLMGGRFSLSKSDSSWFAELVPTINVFSKGRFSEALTLGAGYILDAKNNFLTELTNSINFSPSNQLVVTLSEGNYFFDGRYSTGKAQYIGISVTYNFIPLHSKTDVLKKKALLN